MTTPWIAAQPAGAGSDGGSLGVTPGAVWADSVGPPAARGSGDGVPGALTSINIGAPAAEGFGEGERGFFPVEMTGAAGEGFGEAPTGSFLPDTFTSLPATLTIVGFSGGPVVGEADTAGDYVTLTLTVPTVGVGQIAILNITTVIASAFRSPVGYYVYSANFQDYQQHWGEARTLSATLQFALNVVSGQVITIQIQARSNSYGASGRAGDELTVEAASIAVQAIALIPPPPPPPPGGGGGVPGTGVSDLMVIPFENVFVDGSAYFSGPPVFVGAIL